MEKGRIALVMGSAKTLSQDIARAGRLLGRKWHDRGVAANDAGWLQARYVTDWVSMHPLVLKEGLKRYHGPLTPNLWTIEGQPCDDLVVARLLSPGGDSGLLAVAVGLKLCEKVILCGMPQDGMAGYSQGVDRSVPFNHEAYRAAWMRFVFATPDRIRSMSGWTAETFGTPDRAWAFGDPYTIRRNDESLPLHG